MVAVALGYIMLLPPQFNASIAGSVIPPYRFFLLASVLYMIATVVKREWRFVVPDYLMLVAGGWIFVAFYLNSPFDEFFTAAVAQTSDIVLSYFFARSTFRSLRDFRMFLLLMAPGFALTGALITVESVTRSHILQPLARSVLGTGGGYQLVDYRLGLLRAAGPFPHPILAGIFMASLLPLYWFSGVRSWPRLLGIAAAFASFFTVSSAALLALTLGTGLVAYNWVSERFTNISWRLFFAMFGLFIFVAELGTKSGTFNLLVRFGSLNSDSAFYRTLIWRFGKKTVEKHPFFGIGYGDWDRPFWMGSSVDHYWLLQAIQVGIIPPLMYAIVILLAVLALMKRSLVSSRADKHTLRGVAMAMAVLAFSVVSVAMWLSAQVWFHMMMGISVSLGYGAYAALRGRPQIMRPMPMGRPLAARPDLSAARLAARGN